VSQFDGYITAHGESVRGLVLRIKNRACSYARLDHLTIATPRLAQAAALSLTAEQVYINYDGEDTKLYFGLWDPQTHETGKQLDQILLVRSDAAYAKAFDLRWPEHKITAAHHTHIRPSEAIKTAQLTSRENTLALALYRISQISDAQGTITSNRGATINLFH
jgi:hypothetical protein